MCTHDANGPYCWKCSLNVEWHDCTFCPAIELRRGIVKRSGAGTTPQPAPAVLSNPFRRKNLFKPMKKQSSAARRFRSGFTLIELLTVIAIIGILAAMLLPVLAAAKKSAQKAQARTEIQGIIAAINQYDQDYGRFPLTADEKNAVASYPSGDFTTGYINNPSPGKIWPAAGTRGFSYDCNSNVVAILMDLQAFPIGPLTSNNGHVYNPKQVKYLNAKMSGYDPTHPALNPPGGVDQLGNYRDPWGNPYIISMDTSYDDQCADMFYSLTAVSGPGGNNSNPGNVGLSNPNTTINNNFQFHGKVMVWSAGPDGLVAPGPNGNATLPPNKDNILSWY